MPASDQIKSALPVDAVEQTGINQLRAWPYFTVLHLIFFALSNLFRFLRPKRQRALSHVFVENLAQCLNQGLVSCVTRGNLRRKKGEKLLSYVGFFCFAY